MSSKFKSAPPERKKRSRFGIGPSETNKVPPPAVVHIASLGGKAKEPEPSNTSQGIDFNALPCTTYPSYDSYESTPEKLDPKEVAKKVAAAAAAKINANLVAKGKIKLSELIPEKPLLTQKPEPPPFHSHPTVAENQHSTGAVTNVPATTIIPPIKATDITRNDDFYISEVEINDIPIGCRNYLTRTITQDKITQTTKAYVCTKGIYMSPAEKLNKSDDEKPLYLHVQATEPQFVQHGLDRIKQIIGNHYQKKMGMQSQTLPPPAPPSYPQEPPKPPSYPNFAAQANTATTAPLPAAHFVQEKVFIGLDEAPPMFDLKSRLLGVNYQNFNFIASETGAQVILRGRGSGYIEPTSGQESYEAMHAFICHHTKDGVEAAKSLVLSLVNTIQKDLDQYLMSYTTTNNPVGVAMNPNVNSYYQNFGTVMAPPPPPVPAPAKTSVSLKTTKRKFTEETRDPSSVLGYSSIKTAKSGADLKKKSRSDKNRENKEESSRSSSNNTPDESTTFKSPALPFWMTP